MSELITRALGSAFFFGAVSGLFMGFIGSFWVNRLDFHSSISIGIFTGLITVIIGSLLFPPLGVLIRIYYFGINPADFPAELSLLFNYSLLGLFPGILTSVIAGILGGMATGSIGHISKG